MSAVSSEVLNALTVGISSEIASYVFYLEASRKPQAVEIKSVLEELALEEKKHFQILERQHNSLIKSEQWISLADVLKGEHLPEIGEDMAEVHKELLSEVQQANSIMKILDIAYRLEEEAYSLFLNQEKAVSSSEGKKVFSELAKFEQGHMRQIDQLRQKYSAS